ncbi:SMI1/KNR4 family protein [Streptomyces sp. NBC_01304]|uniref:SMI1/KNR4 family protein n=1 Tax=Streptomyces sp. NBC_01304 TaxID=2903818 RepID=UPI002E0DE406|nr:SMI1/KNR4 family protein [Streptomyces sp. NBC_01304]
MNPALARLAQLIPPPAHPRDTDWSSAEQTLGLELPQDYKELIHAYGGSNWDDYLYLLEPDCPNDNYDLIEWEDQQAEALEGLWEFEKKPPRLEEEGSRVIPWATTDNGECLYWLIKPGQGPADWTVLVNEARGERWEHHPLTCTQFLVKVLSGVLTSGVLSSRFPLATHAFRQLRAV